MRSLRMRHGAPAALLITAALFAGCSSTPTESATDDSAPTGSAATGGGEGTTQYPLTLTSPFGETVLDEIPEKIAVVSFTTEDLDSLTALGITPVFAMNAMPEAPWLDAEQAAALSETTIGSGQELRPEEIAATDPDLIVAIADNGAVDQATYDQLKAVAPVLTYPEAQTGEFTIGWQDSLTLIAEAVDRQAQAEEIIADVEGQFEQVRTDHPEFADATAAFIVNYGAEYGTSFFSATGTNAASVLEQLGFQPAPAAGDFVSDSTVSEERFDTLDVDVLFIGENAEEADWITSNPLFQQLAVYKDNRYVEFTFADQPTNWAAWGLRSSSAQNLPWIIQQLTDGAAGVLGS